MKIHVWSKMVDVDQTVRDQIERRLQFWLGRLSPRIILVKVRIADINEFRVGEGKTCRIDVQLRPTGNISDEVIDIDIFAAVDRAGRAVARKIGFACASRKNDERKP